MSVVAARSLLVRAVREYNERSNSVEVRDFDGVMVVRSEWPNPSTNFLHVYEDVAPSTLKLAAEVFTQDDKPYSCYAPLALFETVAPLVSESSSSPEPIFSTMMSGAIQASDNINSNAAVTFELVKSHEQVGRFASICAAGFSLPLEEQQSFVQPPDNNHQHWVGRVDGVDVATGTLMLLDNVGWIADVVTMPEFQRRGIATAMVGHLQQQAHERDCGIAGLAGAIGAQGIYRRAGFVSVEPYIRLQP